MRPENNSVCSSPPLFLLLLPPRSEIEFKEESLCSKQSYSADGPKSLCGVVATHFSILFFFGKEGRKGAKTLCYSVTSVMSCQLYLVMRAGVATDGRPSSSFLSAHNFQAGQAEKKKEKKG